MKPFKRLSDLLFWAIIAALLLYLLYQKGVIGESIPTLSPKEAYTLLQDDTNETYSLVDVRTVEEYFKEGHIQGALLMPLERIKKEPSALTHYKSRQLILYCRSGNRSLSAARLLKSEGYKVSHIAGGIANWRSQQLPIE